MKLHKYKTNELMKPLLLFIESYALILILRQAISKKGIKKAQTNCLGFCSETES